GGGGDSVARGERNGAPGVLMVITDENQPLQDELAATHALLDQERQARRRAETALEEKTNAHERSTQILRQMTASLMEKERRTRGILEAAADGIITLDENDTIETFNPAAEAIFGYPPVEVIGHSVRPLFAADRRQSFGVTFQPQHPGHVLGRHGEIEGLRK